MTQSRNIYSIVHFFDPTVLMHDFPQSFSLEGNEVFWVGLVIMEDHKHAGLLLVVHQTVVAVSGI